MRTTGRCNKLRSVLRRFLVPISNRCSNAKWTLVKNPRLLRKRDKGTNGDMAFPVEPFQPVFTIITHPNAPTTHQAQNPGRPRKMQSHVERVPQSGAGQHISTTDFISLFFLCARVLFSSPVVQRLLSPEGDPLPSRSLTVLY